MGMGMTWWSSSFKGRVGLSVGAVDSDNKGTTDEDVNPYEALEMEAERQRRFNQKPPETDISLDMISFGSVKEAFDSFLIADFFFVVASLVWLAAGVAAKFVFKTEAVYLAWYALWPLVFQPAIGFLMMGAIGSGVAGWWADQQEQEQQQQQK